MNKTKLTSISDFYNPELKILEALNENKNPEPLPEEEISKIRLAKYRDNSETVELPESLKTILRYDKNFTVWDEPLLKHFFENMNDEKVVLSKSISRVLREETPFGESLSKLPKEIPIWNDKKPMPALIELYSPGDQGVYLYIGNEENGEYPIARFDDEPAVWISASSLIQELITDTSYDDDYNSVYSVTKALSDDFDVEIDFQLLTKKVKEKYAEFEKKEWWDENKELQKFFESFDD